MTLIMPTDYSVYFFSLSGLLFTLYFIYELVQIRNRHLRRQAIERYKALGPKRKIITDRDRAFPPTVKPTPVPSPGLRDLNRSQSLQPAFAFGKTSRQPFQSPLSTVSSGLKQRPIAQPSPFDRLRNQVNRDVQSPLRPALAHGSSSLRHSSFANESPARQPEFVAPSPMQKRNTASYLQQESTFSQNYQVNGLTADPQILASSTSTERVLVEQDTNVKEVETVYTQAAVDEKNPVNSRKRLYLVDEESVLSTPTKGKRVATTESAKKRKVTPAKKTTKPIIRKLKDSSTQYDHGTPKSTKRKATFALDKYDDEEEEEELRPEDGWITPKSRREGKRPRMTPLPPSSKSGSVSQSEKVPLGGSTPLKPRPVQNYGRVKLTPNIKKDSLKSFMFNPNLRRVMDDDAADELTIQLLKAASPSLKASSSTATEKKTETADTKNVMPTKPPVTSLPLDGLQPTRPETTQLETPEKSAIPSFTLPTTTSSTFSFGTAKATPATEEKKSEANIAISTATTSKPLLGGDFQPPTPSSQTTTAPSKPASIPAFSFGAPSPSVTTAASTAASAPSLPAIPSFGSFTKKEEAPASSSSTTSTSTPASSTPLFAFKSPVPVTTSTPTIETNSSESGPGTSAAQSESTKPTASLFSFGASTAQSTASTPSFPLFGTTQASTTTSVTTAAPNFSFGATKTEAPKTSVPSFGFGAPVVTTQPQISNAASLAKPDITTNSTGTPSLFSFGSQSQGSSSATSAPSAISTPAFGAPPSVSAIPSFGSATTSSTTQQVTAPSFGITATSSTTTQSTAPSPFSFGASASQPTTSAPTSSTLSFGAAPKTSAPSPFGTVPSFGATQPASTSAVTSSAPSFSFGSSTPSTGLSTSTAPSSTPSFSFNAPPKPATPTTATPSFGFNGPQTTSTAGFGAPVSTAPSFAFGAATPSTQQPPAFGFGSNNSNGAAMNTTPSPATQPAFSFGGSSNTSSGFGAPSTQAPAFGQSNTNAPAPIFGSAAPASTPFSGNSTPFGSNQPAASPFSFGGQQQPSIGQPAFGAQSSVPAGPFQFAGQEQPGAGGASAPMNNSFQFGGQQPAQGQFQFGAGAPPAAPGGFSFAGAASLGTMPATGRKLAQPKGRLRKGRGGR